MSSLYWIGAQVILAESTIDVLWRYETYCVVSFSEIISIDTDRDIFYKLPSACVESLVTEVINVYLPLYN